MLYGAPPPGPESYEPAVDPDRLTADQKVYAWRLLEMTSAARADKSALTLSALNWLTILAKSACDLHDACDALRAGCTPQQAVAIFK